MTDKIAPDRTKFVFGTGTFHAEYDVVGRAEDMPFGLANTLSKFLRAANSPDFKKNVMTQIDAFGLMGDCLERFFLHFLGAENGREAVILLDVMPMSALPELLAQVQALTGQD